MRSVEITYSLHPSAVPPPPLPANTEAARRRLEEGNRLFVALLDQIKSGAGTERRIMRLDPRHLGLLPGETGAPEQRPFAAFVGCADARVPIELLFSEGPNDLFVIRIAGNGLGGDALGSLSYAVDHLGESLRAIVVLGHSGCGAISAAVDIFLCPELSLRWRPRLTCGASSTARSSSYRRPPTRCGRRWDRTLLHDQVTAWL